MMKQFPDLDIYRFRIRLKLSGELVTPRYKGSLLRGAFAWSFRNTVCVTKQPVCDSCMLKDNCSYFKIFETELPVSEIPYMKGIKKVPHPFVLIPPINEQLRWNTGEILEIELKLFGSSVQLLPYFVYVFKNIGKIGLGKDNTQYELINFTNIAGNGWEHEVLAPDGENLSLDYKAISISEVLNTDLTGENRIQLNFTTPLRIQEMGKVVRKRDEITPKKLLINISRRYLALAGLYGKDGFVEEFPLFNFENISIVENNLQYYDWGRYSNKQKVYLDMSGFTGTITLTGELDEIIPWLKIGSQINMGKNSAFGLGKFEVTESQSNEVTE